MPEDEQQEQQEQQPTDWYGPRRRRRWPWVAAPVAVVVLVAGGLVVQHRTTTGATPVAPAPAAPTAVVPAAPGEAGFALTGAGDAVVYLQSAGAVQRAELGSGAATVTSTPALVEPSSFFAGPGWVVSKTADDPSGFLLRDGGTAQLLPVPLQQAGRAYPAGTDGMWVVPAQPDRDGGRTATVVDLGGDRVGDRRIRVPGPLGVPAFHLTDSLVSVTPQGTYAAGPTGSRRLSGGTLLAVGSDALLTWDCNTKKRCDARVNQAEGSPTYVPAVHKSLEGLYGDDVTTAADGRGALSPDRRWVALELPKPMRSGARLVLVALRSGHRVEVPGALRADSADQVAWTPDGRYLLALTDGRLRVVDTTTEAVVTIGGTTPDLRHLTVAGSATG